MADVRGEPDESMIERRLGSATYCIAVIGVADTSTSNPIGGSAAGSRNTKRATTSGRRLVCRAREPGT
jgi:hypothetical protein